ncbi:hypothetical protein GCM10011507_19750 [Edaphobacter acidisoli]|uniref:TonB-dependent transporter Oar-like beta-barrel domain-containing protein n=1 Tax=Edaphobacter acidisoli TaxID=2040573 RepID=A0A916RT69_9BACT|nr:TonB-dependent receptor [Edaphobacter acidisoli]GGA68285.1 hypothetical protein GCM10011507_19750 [Edaphobacter acidisoli]
MRTLKFSLFILLFSLLPALLVGQADRGGISGRVTDNTGAVLPQTTVTLRNEGTGVVQTAVTNADGVYTFQNLNPGSYDITVNRSGFKKVEHAHTVVDVNQVNQQDISLQIGGNSEVVEVTTGVQQLQTTSGSIGMVVEQRSIQELPLVYSNPFTLEVLAPGILVSGVNPDIHAYDSSTATVSVNGSVLNSLEYRLDGAPDNRIRLSAYTPGTEFINQYKVETASYDATEGHSSGGFVNTSLKSGTNQFHGVAFSSYQNPTLNTNYWHLAPGIPAKAVWLREGGAIGGPIKRDKLFFFTGYEHSRAATPNVQTLTIPSLAERGGNLSELYALDPSHPAGTSNKYQLYDPTTGQTETGGPCGTGKTCVVRQPIPGNIITNINPIAAAALKYYPTPNTTPNSAGGGNFSYAGAEPDYYWATIARVDYTINPKQQLFGHWVQSRRFQKGKNAYFTPVSGTNLTYQNKGAAFGYTYTINPTLVFDAHLTWTRFVNQNTVPSQGILNATTIGMPSYLVDGLGPTADFFPRLDITGYQSLDSDNGVLSHDDVTLGSVQISKLVGKHFLRAGYEYRMYNTNGGINTQSNGRYQHNGSYTTATNSTSAQSIGFGLAQFEYGLPQSSAITINSDLASRSNYMAEWLQDDWKAQPNLTINLGVRFEYEGPNNERNQKANTYFDFNAVNPVAAASQANYAAIAPTNPLLPAASAFTVNGGLRFLGDPSTPFPGHQTYHTQILNVLPRAGFSYEFANNTVVRGGFGIFDDSLSTFYMSGGNSGSTSTFLLNQQGFTQTTTASGSPDSGLTFTSTLANPFPAGIAQPTGSSLGLETFIGQSVTFQPTNPKTPYNMRWSLGLEHQFGAWLADMAYVGNHGVHLPIQKDYDAVPAKYLSTYTAGYDANINSAMSATVNNPFYKVLPNTVSLGSSKTVAVSQLLRPYPEFTDVTAYITSGMSIYHSFQATVVRRFTNGASFTSAFTWSKSLDATQYLNPSDSAPWYGLSANDRTFRIASSGIYQLPFGRGRRFLNQGGIVSAITGGWQVQGVYQVQSGQPLSFTGSSLPIYLGTGSPSNSAWGRSGYKKSISGPGNPGNWFNTADWATTTSKATSGLIPGVYGNQYQIRTMGLRFDGLRADFLNQFDGAIQRDFSLSRVYEPLVLQIRGDFINAFNHPVYSAPSSDWTNSTFGEITAQGNQPRIYQFEAFLRF